MSCVSVSQCMMCVYACLCVRVCVQCCRVSNPKYKHNIQVVFKRFSTKAYSCDLYLMERLITTQEQNVQQVLNKLFDCTTFIWKYKLCMVMSCTCFGPRHSPYSYYLCRTSDIGAVGTSSLAMTWFRLRIEPIIYPRPSEVLRHSRRVIQDILTYM